jgi:hypothetical protein
MKGGKAGTALHGTGAGPQGQGAEDRIMRAGQAMRWPVKAGNQQAFGAIMADGRLGVAVGANDDGFGLPVDAQFDQSAAAMGQMHDSLIDRPKGQYQGQDEDASACQWMSDRGFHTSGPP